MHEHVEGVASFDTANRDKAKRLAGQLERISVALAQLAILLRESGMIEHAEKALELGVDVMDLADAVQTAPTSQQDLPPRLG